MKITYRHFRILQIILNGFVFIGFFPILKNWEKMNNTVFFLLLFLYILLIVFINRAIKIFRTTFGYHTPKEIEKDEKITEDLEKVFKKLDSDKIKKHKKI